MMYYFIILFFTIITIDCQPLDEIVECNHIDLSQYKLDIMNIREQEQLAKEILNEYDKNLTTLAYITSSAEFETHLYLNDTSKKRKTDKCYETYRDCLKTIAVVGRQFKNLMHQNSSLRWLLIRTQAIGDAAQNDTTIKSDIQKLKTRIKDIYHRKFTWNNTKIGIDEVQEILGTLNSPNDLLSLWNATYDVAAPMRDDYSVLIALQNQQAKQNRTSAVTHSHI
ncbi:unnamed protein product [Rotaria sp. Silwood1]|nr:unnamed protein product [Rotaria sp. Silwood1]CAF3462079.1 unnamed protein product [Rotaria sp. Silwood1]CAF4509294.1 unnamed protein product [Rotaria sp. Silwood1]CAF4594268.1 unnamed protein product [Rotaria sp. Silwood1]CAF4633051.1 unnamed protein product [Rotaria sp. Silwood1]